MDTPQRRPPDQEVLERYVLGQLTDRERQDLERVLAADPAWRQALDRELKIAAGARRLGRDRLKRRLRGTLDEPTLRTNPWPRILAAAASVVIIVGVLVISRWFGPGLDKGKGLDQPASDIALEQRQKPAPAEQEKSATQGSNELSVREEPAVAARRVPERKETPKATASSAQNEDLGHPVAAGLPAEQGTWTQAQLYLLPGEQEAGVEKLRADTETLREQLHPEDLDVSRGHAQERQKAERQVPVNIAQGRISSLASGARAQFASAPPDQIPALVQESDTAIRVVLYPPVPFDAEDLRHASIIRPEEDSLLVTIGTQQIGVRMPPGTLRSSQLPVRR